jgi:hypothetical protein
MTTAIRPAARTAAAAAFAVAALALPLGAATHARAADLPQIRLAQATTPGARTAAPATSGSMAERRLAELKKRLRITAAQEPKFQAFTSVVQQNAEQMGTVIRQAQQKAAGNAVERLRASEQLADTQAASLKRLVPAFESLYDTLSTEQKRTADQLFAGSSASTRRAR